MTHSIRFACALMFALSVPAMAQQFYWPVHDALTLTNPKEWKLVTRLQVDHFNDLNPPSEELRQVTQWLDLDGGTVYFPIAPASGHAQLFLDRIESKLSLNDRVVDDTPKIYVNRSEEEPLPGGTFLIENSFNQMEKTSEFSLVITTIGRSWRTVYHEEAAKQIPWPKEWPAVCKSVFAPEPYIDFDAYGPFDLSALRAKVLEWTNGDPQSLPPAITAKWLAVKVAEHYQISGFGINTTTARVGSTFATVPTLSSFEIQGAEYAFEFGRGSKYNLAALLVAAYRIAGIPARMVIGYDTRDIVNRRDRDVSERLSVWVEFALYDEAEPEEERRLAWIPVDIVRLRDSAAWTHDFERPLRYFGTNEYFDDMIPISYHFSAYWVPGVSYGFGQSESTDVATYLSRRRGTDGLRRPSAPAPAWWTWNATPAMPSRASQWIALSPTSPSNRELGPMPEAVRRGNPPRP